MSPLLVNPLVLTRQLQGWRASDDDAAYRSLAEALKLLVLDGRLALNARLPGERRLAEPMRCGRD